MNVGFLELNSDRVHLKLQSLKSHLGEEKLKVRAVKFSEFLSNIESIL